MKFFRSYYVALTTHIIELVACDYRHRVEYRNTCLSVDVNLWGMEYMERELTTIKHVR